MPTNGHTAAPLDPDTTADAPLVIRADLRVELERMLEAVPEAGGDAWESIIGQLISAASPDQLDAPWSAEGMKAYRNTAIVVRGVRRAPSGFEGGLGFYLIVDAADAHTGETFTVTTSSLGCVAQLLRANDLAAFPWLVIPRVSERATKAGFYPMHLEVVRR